MGIGISLKIAPGVRIGASSRGIRASVGPRVARIHAGAGKTAVSSGFGPFSAATTIGNGHRKQAKSVTPPRKRPSPSPPTSKADSLLAGLELASGVAGLIGHVIDRREAKQLAADSVRAAKALTSLHLADYASPSKPQMPSRDEPERRRWNRLRPSAEIEQTAADAEYEARLAVYHEDLVRWNHLVAHDPEEVIFSVDAALADNASQSTCVDAGVGAAGNYVTLVVLYPGLEITDGVVQSGANTRPRSDKEKTELYKRALASTVIATAKEALTCAPAAIEAYVVVLRYDMRGRFGKNTSQLDAIFAGALNRRVLGVDWSANSAVDVAFSARAMRINQDRKGQFKPLGKNAGEDIAGLVAAFADATSSAGIPRHRYTYQESLEMMNTQDPEQFSNVCVCPGCGTIEGHSLRVPRPGEPAWADSIRTCRLCNREWAQA